MLQSFLPMGFEHTSLTMLTFDFVLVSITGNGTNVCRAHSFGSACTLAGLLWLVNICMLLHVFVRSC